MMVAYLGLPPLDWLERSQLREHYFDARGMKSRKCHPNS